ncbi:MULTISPECIES: hypothetical protein [unclassified Microbacterium]|uniref:hypothetical protein n=1 Tax=unclassified Microbacterium TaxID=2609290 RepID=UPI003C2BACCD
MTTNEPKTTDVERRLTAAQRADAALQMRLRRATYREIARAVGYSSPGNAYRAVEREIARVPREHAKQLRAQELETLDTVQAKIMGRILDGTSPDLWAIDRVLAIMDRRARLMGLYDAVDTSGVDEFKTVLKAWASTLTAEVDAEERLDRTSGQITDGKDNTRD